jgi:hypothetical protein
MAPHTRIRTLPGRVLLLLALLLFLPAAGAAQSLRGSRRSVRHSYHYAERHDLTFIRTVRGVRRAVRAGALVRLRPNGDFTLKHVTFPYLTPTTYTFVKRLAAQYRAACGQRLVITSALRPEDRQPVNSSPRSLHPTGIAIDLHRPHGRCLRWLRHTLLVLEDRGVVDATEEHYPPHFHVNVFGEPYREYLASR